MDSEGSAQCIFCTVSQKHDADDKYSRYMAFVDAVNRSSVHPEHIHCVLHSSVLILQHGVLSEAGHWCSLQYRGGRFGHGSLWNSVQSIKRASVSCWLSALTLLRTLSFRVKLYYLSLYIFLLGVIQILMQLFK